MGFDLSRVDTSWMPFFESRKRTLDKLHENLLPQISKDVVLPQQSDIFNAFSLPLADVKVVIVGQDPYPTPGHAHGLAFSVRKDVGLIPRSLVNVFKELQSDIGCLPPSHGDLSHWHEQGVMLLNRVLTVQNGDAGSHRKIGWEEFTYSAIEYLALHNPTFVAILWGNDAQEIRPAISGHATHSSVHPSPLSAHRGFFGSKPFSFANSALSASGHKTIDWCLQ
jgi:uracil-DNA glycosylase